MDCFLTWFMFLCTCFLFGMIGAIVVEFFRGRDPPDDLNDEEDEIE